MQVDCNQPVFVDFTRLQVGVQRNLRIPVQTTLLIYITRKRCYNNLCLSKGGNSFEMVTRNFLCNDLACYAGK